MPLVQPRGDRKRAGGPGRSDIRLYVTLARLDIRYTAQLGETKRPLYTYKNLWGYAKELWEIPAFKNNTFFADFCLLYTSDAADEL